MGADTVDIGPSDYVAWLTDRKWAYIRMEGRTFGDVPLNLELKMEVWDSPNSAGVVIDAVRCCKLSLDHKLKSAMEAPSSYFMKSPPVQYFDDDARTATEQFIATYGAKATSKTRLKAAARTSGDEEGGKEDRDEEEVAIRSFP